MLLMSLQMWMKCPYILNFIHIYFIYQLCINKTLGMQNLNVLDERHSGSEPPWFVHLYGL
jgi:hypothetical protein